jgi:hypothetical protein
MHRVFPDKTLVAIPDIIHYFTGQLWQVDPPNLLDLLGFDEGLKFWVWPSVSTAGNAAGVSPQTAPMSRAPRIVQNKRQFMSSSA